MRIHILSPYPRGKFLFSLKRLVEDGLLEPVEFVGGLGLASLDGGGVFEHYLNKYM